MPGAHQVDVDDLLPLLRRHRPRRRHRRRRYPSVRDGDVERPEALDRLSDRGQHRPRVGDVGADPEGPLADPLGRLARLIGVEIDERDRGAAHVELPGALIADSPGTAGNQRDFAVQVVVGHPRASVFKKRSPVDVAATLIQ